MTGERAPAPGANESSWPDWPRGVGNDPTTDRHSGLAFLLVVTAIGVWLLVRLI